MTIIQIALCAACLAQKTSQHLIDSLNHELALYKLKDDFLASTIDSHNAIYAVIIAVIVFTFGFISWNRIRHEVSMLEKQYDEKAKVLDHKILDLEKQIREQNVVFEFKNHNIERLSFNVYQAIKSLSEDKKDHASFIRFSIINVALIINHQKHPDHPEIEIIPIHLANSALSELKNYINQLTIDDSLKKKLLVYDQFLTERLKIAINYSDHEISAMAAEIYTWWNSLKDRSNKQL